MEDARQEQVLPPASDRILELVEAGDFSGLSSVLKEEHPADIAEGIQRLEREHQASVFKLLDAKIAPDVLTELDGSIRAEILENLSDGRIIDLVSAMDSDDAADVVTDLAEERVPAIINALPSKDIKELKSLLAHDEESAGGLMALEIVAVNQDRTARDALKALRLKANEVEDVYNIYVVDSDGVLMGIVSLKDLVLAPTSKKLSNMMETDIVKIRTEEDREEVARLFKKYNLVAAPVVNGAGQLVGRITVDDIIDVLEEEVSEDISLMAGITEEGLGQRSVFKISGTRLPWLFISFFGELISARILNHFVPAMSDQYAHFIRATAFIPMIMAMGGNTGIQSATVVIRGLATGEFRLRDTGSSLVREIGVALVNGFFICLFLFSLIYLWHRDLYFGLEVSLAMVSVLLIAACMGTLVPFLLKRLGVDPAVATGPFITTSNDVLGLIVYFTIISLAEGIV